MIANLVIAQLLFLEAEDPEKDVLALHQQPRRLRDGDGLAILDTMQLHPAATSRRCVSGRR